MNEENKDSTGGNVQSTAGSETVEKKIEDIGSRLSANPPKEVRKNADAPKEQVAVPFDFDKLTPEQLQSLKARLAVTPERVSQKKANARAELRRIDGRYITAIKNSYLALVYDPTRLAEVETHIIPVKFHDSEKFVDINWAKFMLAERVSCEILRMSEEKGHRVEGEILQRETGKYVQMEVTTVNYFFTIKLPDGKEIEVDGSASNA